ncbi:MAG: TRAP transporter large permease subunit, partial [Burkholderiales bacterium]
DLLAAHLFCFYGAMLSAITPPVAMAAYAAASIANANPFRIAVTACGFGAAAFVVPFCFVINPALIGLGTIQNVLISVLTAVVGCTAIASAVQGWFLCRMSIIERVGAFLGGLLLTSPEFFTDLIGAIFITLAVIRQLLVQKGEQLNQRRSNLTK